MAIRVLKSVPSAQSVVNKHIRVIRAIRVQNIRSIRVQKAFSVQIKTAAGIPSRRKRCLSSISGYL